MYIWRVGETQPGRGKKTTNTSGLIFPLEFGTKDHRTVLPRSRSTTHLGDEWARCLCLPLLFLHHDCTAFWTISKAAFRRHSSWKGRWRNSLRSLSLLLLLVAVFGAPCSLKCQGFWCQLKVDHTHHPQTSWHVLFSWFRYILHYAELFLYKLFKIIYVRFECIPVFLLFRLPTFLQVART